MVKICSRGRETLKAKGFHLFFAFPFPYFAQIVKSKKFYSKLFYSVLRVRNS